MNRLITFILVPASAFLLDLQEIGLLVVVIAYQTFFSLLFKFGADSYISSLAHDYRRSKLVFYRKIFSVSKLIFLSSLLMAAVIFLCFSFKQEYKLACIVLFSSLSIILTLCLTSYYRIIKNSRAYFLYSAVMPFLSVLLFFILILSDVSIYDALLLRNIIFLALIVHLFPFLKLLCSHTFAVFQLKKRDKYILLFGGPLIFHGIFSWLISYNDRLVIDYYYGEELIAIYSIPYSLALAFNVFSLVVSTVISPLVILKYREGIKDKLERIIECTRIIYSLSFLFFLMLISVNFEFILHFINSEYSDYYYISDIILLSYIFIIPYYIYINSFFALGLTSVITRISLSVALFNFVSVLLLVYLYKALGAALAMLLTNIFMLNVLYYYLNKHGIKIKKEIDNHNLIFLLSSFFIVKLAQLFFENAYLSNLVAALCIIVYLFIKKNFIISKYFKKVMGFNGRIFSKQL